MCPRIYAALLFVCFLNYLSAVADPRTFTFNADDPWRDGGVQDVVQRQRRDATAAAAAPTKDESVVIPKINHLNDTHKQMKVHWCKSKAVICLAKDPPGTMVPTPSGVYISYDYGDSYVDKTQDFKLDNGSIAITEKFTVHPEYDENIVFSDSANKVIFITSNTGRNLTKINLSFTPSEVSFHKYQPKTFVILDTVDVKRTLWMTEDFGQNWRLVDEYVKSYFWIEDKYAQQRLVFERTLPSNLSTVVYTNKQQKLNMYVLEVEKVTMKNDYIFTAMKNKRHSYDVYVSYKFGKKLKCVFDTNLPITDYLVVDVDETAQRAFIAVGHTASMSNLYVSENLAGREERVHFTLSMANVMAHFPNATWKNSWLNMQADESFADVYKVEGIAGIYIASQVIQKPNDTNIGPSNIASRITFDHGGSWRPLKAPLLDMEDQPTSCFMEKNCSLHISQKLNQLHPDARPSSIVSSKSAPGIIMATGVIGNSLRGHFGIYVSTDAGITWRHVMRDFYFFNVGDHGGVMVAARGDLTLGKIRNILYSTNEGEDWLETPFHDKEIRVYGLMTEPEEKTSVFTMFGSLPDKHQWMVVKVDLRKVFSKNCTEEDFKSWSPLQKDEHNKYVPCVLGKQKQYKKRQQKANCLVGEDFKQPIAEQICECEQIDYECDFAFVRTEGPQWQCVKNSSIVEDPYVVPATCQAGEFYNRTKGYRKISGDVCIDGYANQYQPDIIPCPTEHVNNMLLYSKREKIVQVDLLTLNQTNLDIPNLKNVIAIDFDQSNDCVYWADIITDTIGRFCDKKGTPIETLVASDLTSVEGMALDWLSKNLYFVDGIRAVIELIRTDIQHAARMRRTILNDTVLNKPRGLAVHPTKGYLYWTDWATNNPCVMRSNLDGSYIKVIADKKLVEWPNGVTIDYIAERVYWVDARKDYIGSTTLDGGSFRKVDLDAQYVSHPFAVAVFKDQVYWDDWRVDAIFTSNKDFGGAVRTLVANVSGLMDIKVIAHGIQHGSNKCSQETSPCHSNSICVGAPKAPFYTCLCPDGMEMKGNECVCPGGQSFLDEHFNCAKINGTCSSDQFACKNGSCIPKQWRCDGQPDCGDHSDEDNCVGATCPPNHFICGDGKCIPHYWKCDFEMDCADGSDEMNCGKHKCTDNQFTCDNGRCISQRWRCDNENDCRDNSDEKDCAKNPPDSCKEDEFKCLSGETKCISLQWKCDGESDCRDGSDEVGCKVNHTCVDTQFSCNGPGEIGECVYKSWVCDGDKDCTNGADEANCTSISTHPPPYVNPFTPVNGSECQEWMFRCSNNKCIPIWWKCDRANDCEDGSDEIGCNYPATTPTTPESTRGLAVCSNNQFECGTGECISMAWVCDETMDCINGEDERNCDAFPKCNSRDQFRCRIDGNCIPLSDVCNDKRDCPDGTDEQYCATNHFPGMATPSCSLGYFPCDQNRCFPLAALCDNKIDCADGTDESVDPCKQGNFTRVYQVLQMGVDARNVSATSALLYWWISLPDKLKLEFLPSISSVDGPNHDWLNKTWISDMEYKFDGLEASHEYNMTVYVRVNGKEDSISPPAKYFQVRTADGVPSPPYNLTVQQTNSSGVLLSWNAPTHPNGEIKYYEIFWSPPTPAPKMRLPDNSTSYFLDADFEPSVTYKFYVIAHNNAAESAQSEVVPMNFHVLPLIDSLVVSNITANSVNLTWTYPAQSDGFMVLVNIRYPYPKQANHIVTTNTILIDNLPPGVRVTFKVAPFKGKYTAPSKETFASTLGDQLPTVPIRLFGLHNDVGNSVKISWDRVKDSRKVTWLYGIYYGLTAEELLEGPRMNTTDLSATVVGLDACENYMFSVGVIAPFGTGPILKTPQSFFTKINNKAAPKKVSVQMIPKSPLQMQVQWAPSCSNPTQQKSQLGYILEINDKIRQKKNMITVVNATGVEMSKVFNVSYGAIYEIRIRTDIVDSSFSPAVVYAAPPIMPPHSLIAVQEVDGSFAVFWTERTVPEGLGQFDFEVFVSEGDEFNATTCSKYTVKAPPFIFKNHTAAMYTFAVRVKSTAGYSSVLSETHTTLNVAAAQPQTGGSALSIVIPVCLLIGILIAAFGYLVVKYRRLQHSFTRFANSHYDTRSEAATFDDNILDEDDTPQIRGFSDDEPLVVA